MIRILLDIKNDSITLKNVNPEETSVNKTDLEYSILQGPLFRSIDPESVERLKDDLTSFAGGLNLGNTAVYLIFPQALFRTLTLPRKADLSRMQQYNEHKFEVGLIFPFLENNSYSLDFQQLNSEEDESKKGALDLVTVINNEILDFAAEIKLFTGSGSVKVIIPFHSLKLFIGKNFPENRLSLLMHISGSTLLLASIQGRNITSVYSANFIDIPSLPDVIDSFLLNSSAGKIDREAVNMLYISLEEYKVGLSSLVEKWTTIRTSEDFLDLQLGKISKVPPDLLAEIRNEA
ncbi:MAG: hypothetical protein LC102_00705 [Ignavibacteriales bacterium]|nr:MAG: hypothetical protein F9K26_03575 [Ignavibacteriaceae bacterium]MBW7872514.1 hypothetical protein [Ignavibacteria bacterium]MCZ2141933.1 hypothetical protein [Ignavibacteriales bacterium]OQY73693.1 MAG: hypothetical protein B6D45_07805 [Ignavibacteriales bacterium UTCHB3]MBV6445099.1 hypothetical protein [Ignavibacteriaceae bacterium]